ncbi:MAG: hypothetical protein Q4D19_02395 [Lautropia sp.]|nr:hypothetical protein [Lautropia sp.]
MARLNALPQFFRTHSSSLYTFVMLGTERVLQMFIGLWIATAIARHFDHGTFASWQITMSLWLVFGTIGNITGERVLLPRLCAEPPEGMPRLWNTALAAKALTGLIAAVPLVLWAATLDNPTIFALALLWALQMLVSAPMSLAVHEAYARDDFRFPQIARIVGMIARLLVVTVLLLVFQAPVVWLVWGWIIEALVLSLMLCRNWLTGSRIRPGLVDWRLMRNIFAQGAALAVASAASVALSRIDRVTLGAAIPADVLSQYSAAMTLLESAFAFATMLATIVGAKTLFRPGPIIASQHLGMTCLSASIAALLSLLLSLIAQPLMTTLYGENYAGSGTYLQIACWLLPLVFAQSILQAPLLLRATKTYHVIKAVTAFGLGALVASLTAHFQHYHAISAGAYVGYLTLIAFDLTELYLRRKDIYAHPGHPASKNA